MAGPFGDAALKIASEDTGPSLEHSRNRLGWKARGIYQDYPGEGNRPRGQFLSCTIGVILRRPSGNSG